MFELFKLRTAHLFTSQKKLARHIKERRGKEDKLFALIDTSLNKLKALREGGDSKEISTLFGQLFNAYRTYLKEIIYKQEEDLELYLLDEGEDLKELFEGVNDFFTLIHDNLPEDVEDQQALKNVLDQTRNEFLKLQNLTKEEFRKIRDQDRGHERYRDHIHSVFASEKKKERRTVKDFKRKTKKDRKAENQEEKELKDAEQALKKLIQDKKSEKEEAEVKKDTEAFHKELEKVVAITTKDLALIDTLIEEARTIITFAVHHYFHIADTEDQIRELESAFYQNGIWERYYQLIGESMQALRKYKDDENEKLYKVSRKIKREERKESRGTSVPATT